MGMNGAVRVNMGIDRVVRVNMGSQSEGDDLVIGVT